MIMLAISKALRHFVPPFHAKGRLILLLFVAVFFLSPCVVRQAAAFDGPLSVRNQFPLFLPANPPVMEAAAGTPSLSVSLSYSSVFLLGQSPSWSVGLDMEITELKFSWRRDLGGFALFGIDVPFLVFGSGFLDGFLDSYHDAFGLPDYGRGQRPENSFLYEVSRDGRIVLKGDNGKPGLGDIRLSLLIPLVTSGPVISLRAGVELPTGRPKAGYGNGTFDLDVSLLADVRVGDIFRLYGNAGVVLPGDLKGHERVELREFLFGGAAVEAALSKRFSLVVQVVVQGSPFPDTDIAEVDRTSVLLLIGGRYRQGNNVFEMSLTEDPNTSGAPDFTVNLTYSYRF